MKQKQKPRELLSSIEEKAQKLKQLHEKWTPHEGQIQAGRALFRDRRHIVFCQCGRGWGKTEFAQYAAWRWALSNSNSQVYIIGPYRNQQYEICWANNRLQTFGPTEYLKDGEKGINKSELRLNFKNGSFIKILGADNPDSLRGVKPHFVIFDEFKDVPKEAFDAMEPNLIAKNAPLLIIGTPPDRECFYVQKMNEIKKRMGSGDKNWLFIQFPSMSNPMLPKKRLEEKRREMMAIGEESLWKREYMAEYVPGGANAIFPLFSRKNHSFDKSHIYQMIKNDKKKLEWYSILDPGTTTCFGGLTAAINRFTSQIFILDEIYEKDRTKTTVDHIWPAVKAIEQREFDYDERWERWADSAAAWFMSEVLDRYGDNIMPVDKFYSPKVQGLSLLRSVMASKGKLMISAHCTHLMAEIENYVTDDAGNIPKRDDHLIDCLRYLVNVANYQLNEDPYPEDSKKRFYSIEHDIRDFNLQNDWTSQVEEDYLEEDDIWMM